MQGLIDAWNFINENWAIILATALILIFVGVSVLTKLIRGLIDLFSKAVTSLIKGTIGLCINIIKWIGWFINGLFFGFDKKKTRKRK